MANKYVGKMEGKVAIVTGGTKGIGAAIVEKILAEGGQVVFTSRKEAEGAAKLAELNTENAAYIVADATSKEDWAKVVAYTLEKFGKITSLVNNAGVCPSAPIMDITEEGLINTFKINVVSQLLGMQAVHDAMVANGGGAIVNFASPSARVGGLGMGEYTATKHAVEGLIKCAAGEWGLEGIRVCGVIPGITITAMTNDPAILPFMEAGAKLYPLGRVANADEIAPTVVFMLSDEASFMTGSTTLVDGGQLCLSR